MDMETAIYVNSRRQGGGSDSKRTRRRMSRREYNTHIFAKARGAKSPVQDLADMKYTGHWWQASGAEKGLADEYEQDAIVNGRDGGEQQWFSSDASDREDFRNKQLDALRKEFRRSLRSHPEFKDRPASELSAIADAYLSGKDHDAFKSDAVNAALQEVSDYVTGDGEVSMSDERTWRGRYAKKEESAGNGEQKPAPAAADVPVAPRNGTPKAPASGTANPPQSPDKSVPLRPRENPQTDVTLDSKWGRTGASDTGVRANGAPVEVGDTSTRNQIKSEQRDSAATDAIEAAETRRDAQNRAKSGDRRRYQQYLADQDALDASMEARRERREAERQKKEQDRRDRRFKDRKLVNQDDWENLGREGSNRVDYADAKNADAKKARDRGIAELQDRFARLGDRTLVREGETAEWKDGKMVVTDKDGNVVDASKRTTTGVGDDGQRYANDFYAYDPNRQRDLAGLRKLVEKGIKDGTITDAQIEGVTKTLDGWEAGAQSRKSETVGREQRRQAEQMAGLRRQYGMEDKEIYDDTAVRNYHDKVQGDRRREILGRMAAGGSSAKAGDYGAEWQNLLDAGFDPRKTLKAALADEATAKTYNDARMKIDTDGALSDQARAEMRDQLKHRTIMTQAFKDAGIEGAQAADIGAIRQETVGAMPAGDYQTTVAQNVQEELRASQPAQQPAATPALEPKKPKKDDEVGASLGGYAMPLLRPRRRS